MKATWTIARKEITDALKNKLFLIMLAHFEHPSTRNREL